VKFCLEIKLYLDVAKNLSSRDLKVLIVSDRPNTTWSSKGKSKGQGRVQYEG